MDDYGYSGPPPVRRRPRPFGMLRGGRGGYHRTPVCNCIPIPVGREFFDSVFVSGFPAFRHDLWKRNGTGTRRDERLQRQADRRVQKRKIIQKESAQARGRERGAAWFVMLLVCIKYWPMGYDRNGLFFSFLQAGNLSLADQKPTVGITDQKEKVCLNRRYRRKKKHWSAASGIIRHFSSFFSTVHMLRQ